MIQRDPTARDYDPTVLATLNVPADQIFANEPRLPLWAGAMEKRIDDRLRGDLKHMLPSASLLGVVCHASSCEFRVAAPAADSDKAAMAVQFGVWGDEVNVG